MTLTLLRSINDINNKPDNAYIKSALVVSSATRCRAIDIKRRELDMRVVFSSLISSFNFFKNIDSNLKALEYGSLQKFIAL